MRDFTDLNRSRHVHEHEAVLTGNVQVSGECVIQIGIVVVNDTRVEQYLERSDCRVTAKVNLGRRREIANLKFFLAEPLDKGGFRVAEFRGGLDHQRVGWKIAAVRKQDNTGGIAAKNGFGKRVRDVKFHREPLFLLCFCDFEGNMRCHRASCFHYRGKKSK